MKKKMLTGDISVGNVLDFCREDTSGIDTAVPQTWLDEVRKLGIRDQFVWSYQDKDGNTMCGRPISIGDLVLDEITHGRAVLVTADEYARIRNKDKRQDEQTKKERAERRRQC